MSRERANLGFQEELADFDPSQWRERQPRQRPQADDSRRAAEATGFRSREVPPAGQGATGLPEDEPPKPPRRRRTGRNQQFNLKAKPETIAAFCAVADQHEWGLGETLEKAVELLQKAYGQ